ncbi:MAG: cytochrome P450 [Nocardioidaceae bacterium]
MTTTTTLDLDELNADPFPVYADLRRAQPWARSEQLGMRLVSRYDDVVFVDQHPEIFSSEVDGALTTRAMGLSMLRSEGEQHRRLRAAAEAPLKRRAVRSDWTPVLEQIADDHVGRLRGRESLDLVSDLASPFTGACLAALLGLPDATPEMVRDWSDAFIAGATNNLDDAEIWRHAAQAKDAVQEHVAAAIERPHAATAGTVVSAMAQAHPGAPLTLEEVASNVRLMVAGGFNDARDLIATLAWLLLGHPQIRRRASVEQDVMDRAIDECVRWLSPVGTFPRQLTTDFDNGDVVLRRGERILVLAASANWDESRFPQPERFDVDRPNLFEHVGFSLGMHYCLGTHFVREMVRIAVPRVLALPGLRVEAEPVFAGWMFRGPTAVLVQQPVDQPEILVGRAGDHGPG